MIRNSRHELNADATNDRRYACGQQGGSERGQSCESTRFSVGYDGKGGFESAGEHNTQQ